MNWEIWGAPQNACRVQLENCESIDHDKGILLPVGACSSLLALRVLQQPIQVLQKPATADSTRLGYQSLLNVDIILELLFLQKL